MATVTKYETLLVDLRDGILDVVWNRPEARNAITYKMEAELDRTLELAEKDPAVKAVTWRGAGAVFSAGHDLKEVAGRYASGAEVSREWQAPALPRSWYFPKPLITGVHGYVGPHAMGLTAYSDFIIAAEGTRFSFEQTRSGGAGAGGGVFAILQYQLPMRVLAKLWQLGGWMDAAEAHQFQLVQRVVPLAGLERETRRWAEQAAMIPAEQFAASKANMRRSYEIMGLNAMIGIGNRRSGHGSQNPEDQSFFKMIQEKGLKEALRWRDGRFDQDVARV